MKRMLKYMMPVVALALSAACTRDKGNYDYTEQVTVHIAPLEAAEVVEQLSEMHVTPEISFSDPNATYDDFEYIWYIYQTHGANMAEDVSTIDTLSRERNLSAVVRSVPGRYVLNYKVIDRKTGIYSLATTEFDIINGESTGYALLCDIGGDAELAFVTYSGKTRRNVFETVNGHKAGKNPCALHFPRGNMISLKCLWILCQDENGGSVVSDIDFSEFSNVRSMCVFPPDVFRNTRVFDEGYAPYAVMVTNGKMYNRSSNNSGYPLVPFGAPTPADFEVGPFLFTNITGTGIFYDNGNKRFRKVNTLQYLQIVEWPDFPEDAVFNPKDVGMEMVEGYMCGQLAPWMPMTEGRAVMRDKAGKVHLLSFRGDYSGGINPQALHDISSHPGVAQATGFTIKLEGDYAYYAYGNKIGVSSFITGASLYQYDDLIPANLTIDCIRAERFIGLNELWVAASDGTGGANSGSFFIFSMASDGTLTKKAEYLNCCGKVVDIVYKN